MNTLSSLSPISRNPDKLIATGIAQTAKQLGYGDTGALKKRILGLLTDPQNPLIMEELSIIEDTLTSTLGENGISLLNHRLFCDFDYERTLRERDFADLTVSGLAEFETGGQNKHRDLRQVAEFVASFASEEKKKEPAQITGADIWTHIQNQQFQAVGRQNKRFFLEACANGSATVLKEWTDETGGIQLRHDPKNNLMGALDQKGYLLGETILSGCRPLPHMGMFYGDEWTIPCTDNTVERNLCLVEFNPSGMSLGRSSQWYFSVIEASDIGHRRIIRDLKGDEIFYCMTHKFGDEKVIHSGPGRTVNSNEPVREFHIDGDVIFVAHESTGSCASYKVHSLQTGGYAEIERKNLLSQEEVEGDIVFTFRQREAFNGILHLPGKEPVSWEFGRDWWAKKSVSLRELTQVWHQAAKKAKEKK